VFPKWLYKGAVQIPVVGRLVRAAAAYLTRLRQNKETNTRRRMEEVGLKPENAPAEQQDDGNPAQPCRDEEAVGASQTEPAEAEPADVKAEDSQPGVEGEAEDVPQADPAATEAQPCHDEEVCGEGQTEPVSAEPAEVTAAEAEEPSDKSEAVDAQLCGDEEAAGDVQTEPAPGVEGEAEGVPQADPAATEAQPCHDEEGGGEGQTKPVSVEPAEAVAPEAEGAEQPGVEGEAGGAANAADDENRSSAPQNEAEPVTEQMFFEAEPAAETDDAGLKAVIEAIVYVAEEPATAAQIAAVIQQPEENVSRVLNELIAEYARSAHGITIREVAGGFKMTTKPEHHETIRAFVKSLKPPLKLSLAALETLATIAYKQPITAPEIMEIRGVQGAGVLKTLLDRKLIQTSGRKNVIGRPILYKTTKEFLVQFGLKDLTELPTLKEFEELRRLAASEPEAEPATEEAQPAEPQEAQPEAPAAEPAESTDA
jgi:segregation and condensation protein B